MTHNGDEQIVDLGGSCEILPTAPPTVPTPTPTPPTPAPTPAPTPPTPVPTPPVVDQELGGRYLDLSADDTSDQEPILGVIFLVFFVLMMLTLAVLAVLRHRDQRDFKSQLAAMDSDGESMLTSKASRYTLGNGGSDGFSANGRGFGSPYFGSAGTRSDIAGDENSGSRSNRHHHDRADSGSDTAHEGPEEPSDGDEPVVGPVASAAIPPPSLTQPPLAMLPASPPRTQLTTSPVAAVRSLSSVHIAGLTDSMPAPADDAPVGGALEVQGDAPLPPGWSRHFTASGQGSL